MSIPDLSQLNSLGTGALIVVALIGSLWIIYRIALVVVSRNNINEPLSTNVVAQELQKMNSNHLTHIEDAINSGNRDIVKAINDGNLKMVEILGRIEGNIKNQN